MKKIFKQKRLAVLMILLLAAFGAGFAAYAASANPASAPEQIILSWTGSPSTTQSFTWHDEAGLEECVQLVSADAWDGSFTGAAQISAVSAEVSTTESGYLRYEATAASLTPDTVYYYRVGSPSAWSETKTFKTAPLSAQNFSFIFMGDIQVQSDASAELAAWGALLDSACSMYDGLAFGLLAGDIVENGLDLANWELFLNNADNFSEIPLMTTNGNHESNFLNGKPVTYMQMFALPQNGPAGFSEEFYSFEYGNCHFTVLNSHIFSGEQSLTDADFAAVSAWIENDLASSSKTWSVVLLHHPAYAVSSDPVSASVLENWVPIFERTGVDLVLEGHQHVYSRSYPLYEGGFSYENGITYLMGVSGGKHYSTANETFSAKTVYNTATCQVVEVDGSSMYLSCYDASGNLLDYASLSAREKQGSALRGDADQDGALTAADAECVKNAVLNALPYDERMDMDADGTVDISDAQAALLLYLASLEGGG